MQDSSLVSKVTLSKLQHELNVIFDSVPTQINEWLDTPLPRLAGKCPRRFLETNQKRELLFQVLQEMKHGEMA